MFDSAADDSARVVNHARDALSQGRIGDALSAVDLVRHDVRLSDSRRVTLFLTGLHAKLAQGDLRGGASYARELTNLMRVRGVVGATASFGLGDFAAARGQLRPGRVLLRALRARARRRPQPRLAAMAQRPGPGDRWPRRDRRGDRPGRGRAGGGPAARSTYAIAYALRTYAAVAPTGNRVALLEEALELLDGAGAARLEAQIRTDLAAWILLLQPTESQRAVDHLRAAEKYARTEELGPLLSRIRWLLERLGEAPDGEVPGRMAELSAAEQRVAAARRRRQAQPRDRRRARRQREVGGVARLPHPAQALDHLAHRARRRPGPAAPTPLTEGGPCVAEVGLRAQRGGTLCAPRGQFYGGKCHLDRPEVPFRRATTPTSTVDLSHLGGGEGQPGMATYVVSRYSSMPSKPPSRPKPLAFTPPNGAAGLDSRPVLTPTMPNSSDSATLIVRARSRV